MEVQEGRFTIGCLTLSKPFNLYQMMMLNQKAPRTLISLSEAEIELSKVKGALLEIPAPFSAPWECHSMGLPAKNNCPKT